MKRHFVPSHAGVLLALVLGEAPLAQADDVPARKTLPAIRTNAPPILDGELGDSVWQHAAIVEDLHVVVSDAYARPSRALAHLCHLRRRRPLLAARFWDSEPDKVTARVLRRGDVSFGEDGFTITLDPYDRAAAATPSTSIRMACAAKRCTSTPAARTGNGKASGMAPPDAMARDGRRKSRYLSSRCRSIPRSITGASTSRAGSGARNEQFGWVSHNREQTLAHGGELKGISGLRQGRGIDVIPGLRFGTTRDHAVDDRGFHPGAFAGRLRENHSFDDCGVDLQP